MVGTLVKTFYQYDYHFSIGSNCRVSNALRKLNLRKTSTPFDWGFFTPDSFYRCYIDKFNNLINFTSSMLQPSYSWAKHFLPTYRIQFAHGASDQVEKVRERSQRLYNILSDTGNKVLLIYNHMLPFLIRDSHHRSYINFLHREEKYRNSLNIQNLSKLQEILPSNVDVLIVHHSPVNIYNNLMYLKTRSTIENETIDWDEYAIMEQFLKWK